jgi:hypothetical protein
VAIKPSPGEWQIATLIENHPPINDDCVTLA